MQQEGQGQPTAADLVERARQAGLPFGVCGGRLWVHLSGEQLALVHLATQLLIHEDAVLGALGVPSHGLPATTAQLQTLRRLRAQYRRHRPTDDQPDGS